MLEYFYDCCPELANGINENQSDETKYLSNDTNLEHVNSYFHLFKDLAIHNAGEQYLEKQGKHPVIFLTFKNIKDSDWETTYRKIQKLIRQEYVRHSYLLRSEKMESFEIEYFKQVIDQKGECEDYENSLENLLVFFNRYYRVTVGMIFLLFLTIVRRSVTLSNLKKSEKMRRLKLQSMLRLGKSN